MTDNDTRVYRAALQAMLQGEAVGGEGIEAINANSRRELRDYSAAREHVWVGKFQSLPGQTPRLEPLAPGASISNFEADFVVPTDDRVLLDLLMQRHTAPYTGTRDDGRRVAAIIARVLEIGGLILAWA